MSKIILTSDRTLMSNYHSNEFLGFATCAPPNFVPDWLYSLPFLSHYQIKKRVSRRSTLRFEESRGTTSERRLQRRNGKSKSVKGITSTKPDVLGIHVMDPFGLGPASTTLATLFKKEPFLAKHFKALLNQPEVKEAKKRGLKIIVGGPGAWQFKYRPEFAEKNGIDCIVEGEGERVLGKIFANALNGEELPKHWEVTVADAPKLDDVPDIVSPSVNGLIEIGRGCCRGCEFCNVTLRPLRWYPIEKIMREIKRQH